MRFDVIREIASPHSAHCGQATAAGPHRLLLLEMSRRPTMRSARTDVATKTETTGAGCETRIRSGRRR